MLTRQKWNFRNYATMALGAVLLVSLSLLIAFGSHACSTSNGKQVGDLGHEANGCRRSPASSNSPVGPRSAESAKPSPRIDVGSVEVEVIDELTSRPVAGATLSAKGARLASTDGAGKATIARGSFTIGLLVEATGYFSKSVEPPLRPGMMVQVTLEPTIMGRGTGTVIDGSGIGVEAVLVYFRPSAGSASNSENGKLFETATSRDGAFEFPISNRVRHVIASGPNGQFGTTVVAPGSSQAEIRLERGADLEIFLEGEDSAGITELELRVYTQISLPPLRQVVKSGSAMFLGLKPRLLVEVSSPQAPGSFWTTRLGPAGTLSRMLIVCDASKIALRLNWLESPVELVDHVMVGLGTGHFHQTGKVTSATRIELPANLAPFPSGFCMRFVSSSGLVVGQAIGSAIRRSAIGEYECDVRALVPLRGRVMYENGDPANGACVEINDHLAPEASAIAANDGSFTLYLQDKKWEHTLVATDGVKSASASLPAGARSVGDLVLKSPRLVRVHIKGDDTGSMFFVGTADVWIRNWPPPKACRVGEWVAVPVLASTTAIVASNTDCEIRETIDEETKELVLWTVKGEWSITLKALCTDQAGGTETALANARFSFGPAPDPQPAQKARTSIVRYASTNIAGEAIVTGMQPGKLEVNLISPAMDEWAKSDGRYELTKDGQQVAFRLVRFKPQMKSVPVIGRISPAMGLKRPALISLDKPLPHPMDSRKMKDLGIRVSIVTDVNANGGAYGALVNPEFPYIAIRVDDELGLYDNAGYLTAVGSVWRADLVVPVAPTDRVASRYLLTSSFPSPTGVRLRLLWNEGGTLRGRDLRPAIGNLAEFFWPRAAERVWLVASGISGNKLLGAMLEPRPGADNELNLVQCPTVKLVNVEGLLGSVALTPAGLAERDWTSLSQAAAGGLFVFGEGSYEFAGTDSSGRIRRRIVFVATGSDAIELDARSVLAGP